MNKVRGQCVPLPLHYAKASRLLSRNSNNGSDPLVHLHSLSLPKVPASILTSLVLCLILLRTLDSVVLILITFAFFLSHGCMAQRGRCPGGRPSVSANKRIRCFLFCSKVATVQVSYEHRIRSAVFQRVSLSLASPIASSN